MTTKSSKAATAKKTTPVKASAATAPAAPVAETAAETVSESTDEPEIKFTNRQIGALAPYAIRMACARPDFNFQSLFGLELDKDAREEFDKVIGKRLAGLLTHYNAELSDPAEIIKYVKETYPAGSTGGSGRRSEEKEKREAELAQLKIFLKLETTEAIIKNIEDYIESNPDTLIGLQLEQKLISMKYRLEGEKQRAERRAAAEARKAERVAKGSAAKGLSTKNPLNAEPAPKKTAAVIA